MLARLLLALLTLVLATPVAAAACHAQSRGRHAGMAHHDPVPADRDDAAPAASCIGCVPPSDWLAPRAAEPMAAPAIPLASRVAPLHLGRGPPPALPPPRIG